MSIKKPSFFNNILLPTDGSEHSLKAARYAAEIAEKCGSKVIIMHVLEAPVSDQPIEVGIEARIAVEDEMRVKERGRTVMERTKKIFDEADIHVVTKYFCCGRPRGAIVRTAEKENIDLIVMGSRGVGGVSRLMLGSVADGVSRQAPCPVLIVR